MAIAEVPSNPTLEASAIGACILDPLAFKQVEPIIKSADFYLQSNVMIWDAMQRLVQRGETIDIVVLCDELERGGQLQEIGGMARLGKLANCVPSALHVREYAVRVAELAERRRTILSASRLVQAAWNEDGEFAAEKARIAAQLQRDTGPRRDVVTVGDAMHEVFAQVEYNVANPLRPGEVRGLSTGLVDLDRLIGGLQVGLHITGAVTSTGKTALCLAIAANVSSSGGKVFYVTPEMTPPQLIERMVCAQARVDSDHLDSGRIPQDEFARFVEWQGRIASWPLIISQADSMHEIRAQVYRETPISLIIIDGIELINGGERDKTHELRGEVAKWGLALATDPDILAPVIIPAQVATKRVAARENKCPQLGDIYASSEPEMATDVVLALHRQDRWLVDKRMPRTNELEVILWKHRLKKKNVPSYIKLRCGEFGEITDLAQKKPPPVDF